MEITVYSKSGCPQCVFTKKYLEGQGLEFTEKRVDLNEGYLEEVKALAYSSLPVVVINGENFSGYQPEKIDEMVLQCQQ